MNNNPNKSQSKTQNFMLLEYLNKGNRITGLKALSLFGTLHLPRRILDLSSGVYDGEKKEIKRQWIKLKNKKRVMEYWISG